MKKKKGFTGVCWTVFFSDNKKWVELKKKENEMWAKEDILRDELLLPELIKIKQKRMIQIENKMNAFNNTIKENEESDEKRKENISDRKWIIIRKYTDLQKEYEELEWELMNEDERAERREMHIISALKIHGFL